MPKAGWKGSAGIVEGGITFTLGGGRGFARKPERARITNDEDQRIAAREKAEALAQERSAKAAAAEADAGVEAGHEHEASADSKAKAKSKKK